jgi:hypothetical protein
MVPVPNAPKLRVRWRHPGVCEALNEDLLSITRVSGDEAVSEAGLGEEAVQHPQLARFRVPALSGIIG